jgi:hypothetical protein
VFRIIKEPGRIDAALSCRKEEAQTNEFLCVSFSGFLSTATPKDNTFFFFLVE